MVIAIRAVILLKNFLVLVLVLAVFGFLCFNAGRIATLKTKQNYKSLSVKEQVAEVREKITQDEDSTIWAGFTGWLSKISKPPHKKGERVAKTNFNEEKYEISYISNNETEEDIVLEPRPMVLAEKE